MFLELETLNEKEDRGDIDGAKPLGIGILKEPGDLRGRKESPKREYVEQTL